MIDPSRVLAGKRVLIVEDELLVALMIEDVLADLGCEVVGPFGSVAQALPAAGSEPIDLAVLDVNLGGEMVYPVAERLGERDIPFLFVSGYGGDAIPEGKVDWKVCAKPFHPKELARMMAALLKPVAQ